MRLLFTCRPTFGHFQPLRALADAARRRGHVVVFATGAPLAGQIRDMGYDAEAVGLSARQTLVERDKLGVVFTQLPPTEIRPFAFGRWFAEIEAPPRLADLDRLCRDFRPDMLVHEVAELAAPLAAAGIAVPWVTVGFGPLLQPVVAEVAGAAMAPFWHHRGLAMPAWGGLYRYLYVDPCPPALQVAGIAALPATIGLRPVSTGTGASGPGRDAGDRIYVTFGTAWNIVPGALARLRLAVEGSADVAAEVVVTVGSAVDPALLGPLPPNVAAHPFIPQDEVLPTCRTMVCHGGAGTLIGGLAWGLPSLLLPQMADQFYNAQCATQAGAALALMPPQITREAVAACLRRLRDEPGFAARARTIRTELAAMPEVDAVLDRIEVLSPS